MSKHITVTDTGYLSSLPKTGPGLIVRTKIQKTVFGPDTARAGWDIRMSGEHWPAGQVPDDVRRMASDSLSTGYPAVREMRARMASVTPWGSHG